MKVESFPVILPVFPESLFYDFYAIYIFTVYLFVKYKLVSYFKISLLLIPSITSVSILHPVILLLMWKPPSPIYLNLFIGAKLELI